MKRTLEMRASQSPPGSPPKKGRANVSQFSEADHARLDSELLADAPRSLLDLDGLGPAEANSWIWSVVGPSPGQLDQKYTDSKNVRNLLEEHPGLLDLVKEAVKTRKLASIRNLESLQLSRVPTDIVSYAANLDTDLRTGTRPSLNAAYNTPFLGDAATHFIHHLQCIERKLLYAQAQSVVQSSGTGKSRMLTEVARNHFTLPICIRSPTDPGFPPSDKSVYKYFKGLPRGNDLSWTAHIAIASFIAAAHEKMLAWLKEEQDARNQDLKGLLQYWLDIMEPATGDRSRRDEFFLQVVDDANNVSGGEDASPPTRKPDGTADVDTSAKAEEYYFAHAKVATENLMAFLSNVTGQKDCLAITYFDEAHELEASLWSMLRLLHHQKKLNMWYIFMGTKSNVSYYHPDRKDLVSLRLKEDAFHLPPPYFALGFDQHAIANSGKDVRVTMGDLSTIRHFARYGRPYWNAIIEAQTEGDMMQLAALKLTGGGGTFDPASTDHVFAVLTQRLCIDPVLAQAEAVKLADRSVAHHMRLLIGYEAGTDTFHTYSPSEPMLALGAFEILYNEVKEASLAKVLDTFRRNLCHAGLIEKGLLGELGARLLLLLARDYAAPASESYRRDPLKPVPLLNVVSKLFGNEGWAEKKKQRFEEAFKHARVNYTHWIVTEDPLPTVPDLQLLANLWARGAALQCSHNQESLDCFIVTYNGPDTSDAIFDPTQLSAVVIQVKFRDEGVANAEALIRPIGLPRDELQPLPYLVLLLELGCSASYRLEEGKKSRIRTMVPPSGEDNFADLVKAWSRSQVELKEYEVTIGGPPKDRRKGTDRQWDELCQTLKERRFAVDSFNRYSISVRGHSSSVYGLLKEAKIENEFTALLAINLPPPLETLSIVQHMRPCEGCILTVTLITLITLGGLITFSMHWPIAGISTTR